MPNDFNSVKITLTTAKYILEQATNLITHLHGSFYDPSTGRLSDIVEESPSLFEQQDTRDVVFLHWLSTTSALLRLIAGILSYEINMGLPQIDEGGGLDDISSLGDLPRLARQWPPALYADDDDTHSSYTIDSDEYTLGKD